ncbi:MULTISPECIES: ABC transporter permease [Clostridium]|uniref:Lipoprotein release ABC transporter permease n=1 Tax=Clostridium sartagoforme AAU1 TaxID=1202534 RepID=R9C663_9CLOT|nr:MULTISPECIES: ABC transporter permease [Clostridium]EOR24490.1 lipoprotein release ABC transporter permease [Clostridium sartagoforme AAU1]KLE14780.1 cell division protein FtsX [Clostridium sp. C8]
MSNMFYQKLAATNIKKNGKTYFPYILTCISSIAMFYIMHFISVNDGLDVMSGGRELKIILNLGTYVIGLFSIIFLFYTNSFLIKRRKKELGLYNILGMEKRHIAKVLFWEIFFVTLISMVLGLLLGIGVSKLIFLVLLKILHFKVPMGFFISTKSLIITAALFGFIFVLTLLNNLRQIYLAKPVELLKGGQVGEKEPRTRWVLTLIGLTSLGSGYYIAVTTEAPLAALNRFFLAVILVMIGTWALFTAGSIALLKMLRKNKKFYYKTNHFINVSGMIYRMKQNAIGLANICILSTTVLVMISTTVSLYIGMEDVLRTRYPRDISISAENVSKEQAEELNSMIKEQAEKNGTAMEDIVKYRSFSLAMIQDKNYFTDDSNDLDANNLCFLELIPLSEYNDLENKSITLNENEVLLFTYRGGIAEDSLNILDNEFKIKERINNMTVDGIASAIVANGYFVVVPDEKTIEEVYDSSTRADGDMGELSYYFAFDTDDNAEKEITLTNEINNKIQELSVNGSCEGVEESRESFFSLYGGLFFLGIFLGVLFIMATVLIIYYKQISEGYDDKERFEIMKKVGMSKEEIKKSISSQVLMVFFMPLLTAIIHIAFAFKVIVKLLAVLNLTNVTLFAFCTAGTIFVFAIFYAIVYVLTSKVYYKIVS